MLLDTIYSMPPPNTPLGLTAYSHILSNCMLTLHVLSSVQRRRIKKFHIKLCAPRSQTASSVSFFLSAQKEGISYFQFSPLSLLKLKLLSYAEQNSNYTGKKGVKNGNDLSELNLKRSTMQNHCNDKTGQLLILGI